MKNIYKDKSFPIEERITDLLNKMKIEEKIGQLTQLDGRVELKKNFMEKYPGSFLQILGSDTDLPIKLARESRLAIPLLLGVDAIHGHSFWKGATIFPTQISFACSWNEDLMEKIAEVTAREMRNTGVSWTFSPVLCLTRDLRWGRVGETFGEDPYLIGKFAVAMIKGYQGEDMSSPDKVLATAKHYAGYSETQGGRDASEADISRRKLKSYFLPPFKEAVKTGVGSFMTGYQSMEGVPSTANKWLLREVLKDEWGFDGFLVTDWDNVGVMVKGQKICRDYKEAAAIAVNCGNDMMMATPDFFQGAIEAYNEGLIKDEILDDAVKRVLRIKFRLGLFEDDRHADMEKALSVIGCESHREVALQAARESAVLLSNNGLLPLNEKSLKKIAIVGPNCDNALDQLGDWSLGTGQAAETIGNHPDECTITVLKGITTRFNGEISCSPDNSIKNALKAAEDADLIIAVIGDRNDLVVEFCSTTTLELQDGQIELMNAIRELGKPVLSVLINRKQLDLPKSVYTSDAVIEQFSPGMLGGQALAEIIFGDFNPCGKLTISFPYHVGQQPVFYSQVRGQHGDKYADMTQDPLYPFGFGKSYTEFEYGPVRLEKDLLSSNETLNAKVRITNKGDRDGTEITQAYISDLITSATWVNKELKGYKRTFIKAGETKEITIEIETSQCSIVNASGDRVVESGEFQLSIGSSSKDEDLEKKLFTIR
jgi:beta-glucosidase